MIRTFKTAKVQLLMVGEGHEDGINRSFSHIDENATDDQSKSLVLSLKPSPVISSKTPS